jgi:hypothetical protein
MRSGISNTSSTNVLGTSGASAHKVLWKFKSETGGFTSIALGPEGTVYAGANNSLYALSPEEKLKWKTPLADCFTFRPEQTELCLSRALTD